MLALALAASAPAFAGGEKIAEATPGLELSFGTTSWLPAIAPIASQPSVRTEPVTRRRWRGRSAGARHSATAFECYLVSAVPYQPPHAEITSDNSQRIRPRPTTFYRPTGNRDLCLGCCLTEHSEAGNGGALEP